MDYEILKQPYSGSKFQEYRTIYAEFFKKKPSNCGCAAGAIFNAIVEYAKRNKMI